jgi:hypothetical protein
LAYSSVGIKVLAGFAKSNASRLLQSKKENARQQGGSIFWPIILLQIPDEVEAERDAALHKEEKM